MAEEKEKVVEKTEVKKENVTKVKLDKKPVEKMIDLVLNRIC